MGLNGLKVSLLNIEFKVTGCCWKFSFFMKSAADATSGLTLVLEFLKITFYIADVCFFF